MNRATCPAPCRILMVEDDREDFQFVEKMLSNTRQGQYTLEWASSYEDGVKALGEQMYDAVLLDFFLGKQNGLAFLKEVNAKERPFPFIVISGRANTNIDLDVFEAGATFSLTKKEMQTSLLKRSIHYAIERRKLEEQLKQSERQLRNNSEMLQKTADTLRASEEKFRGAFDNATIGFAMTLPNGQFLDVNAAYCALTGYSAEELRSSSFSSLVHPEDLVENMQLNQQMIRGEIRDFVIENRYIRKDRQVVWVRKSVSVQRSPTGEPLWIIALVENITERRRAELALQVSEDKFAKSFRSNPAILSITRVSDGRYLDVNESFTRCLGYSREEVIGRTSVELGFITSKEERDEIVRWLREKGRVQDMETKVRTKSGQFCDVLFSLEPIEVDNEACFLITFIDITERKRAEAEREQLLTKVQRQKELMERLVQNAPIGIAVLYGPEHRFQLVNSVQQNLFPTIQNFVGRTVSEVWSNSTDVFLPILDRVYQTGEPYYAVDAPWQTDKGQGLEETFYSFSYTPLYNPEGAIEGILVISVETTEQLKTRRLIEAELAERKRAEAELAQAHASLNEERNLLLAVMEALPIGLAIYDTNGGVIQANTGFDAIWGPNRPPANSVEDYDLYKAWWVHSGQRVLPQEWAAATAVREGKTVTGQFIKIQRFDGSQGYILNSGAPVRDMQGRVVGGVVTIMDITDRVEAEKALQISEEHFRVALKNSPMLVYTTDQNLRYTWIYNPAFGFDPAQVIGKTDEELNLSEDVSELVAIKQSVLETGVGKRQEIRMTYQGQQFIYDLTVEPLANEQGKVTGLTVAAIDITDQKQMEYDRLADQIQIELQRRLMDQREQERQQIARDIHDGPIQTLVSTIFNVQVTKESLEDPLLQMELSQIGLSIKNAVQELREVVNELRPPSLLRFGLAKAIKIHAVDFQEKHPDITLTLDLENDNTPLLQGTLSEQLSLTLFRIYQEAMNNITRHAQAKSVRVQFLVGSEEVLLEITDDGKGFEVGHDLTTQTQKGHYGMAGMKERTEAIRGLFQIFSRPGSGTSVKVVVPVMQSQKV